MLPEHEHDNGWAINRTNGRACVRAPFGVACYVGYFTPDRTYEGIHCGVVGTAEDVDRWLAGELPEGLIKVYDEPTAAPS